MEPRTSSNKLLLTDFAADLIFEAEDDLHDLILKAEPILDDSKLALDNLAFLQHSCTVSKGCSTSQAHDRTSIFSPSSAQQHIELRRCQKYAELRDASRSIVEIQRLEMQYGKPRVVYIRGLSPQTALCRV